MLHTNRYVFQHQPKDSADKRKLLTFHCSTPGCRNHKTIYTNKSRQLPDLVVNKKLLQEGWKLGKPGKGEDKCPVCSGHLPNSERKIAVSRTEEPIKMNAHARAVAEKFFNLPSATQQKPQSPPTPTPAPSNHTAQRSVLSLSGTDKKSSTSTVAVEVVRPKLPAAAPAPAPAPVPAPTQAAALLATALPDALNEIAKMVTNQTASQELLLDEEARQSDMLTQLIKSVDKLAINLGTMTAVLEKSLGTVVDKLDTLPAAIATVPQPEPAPVEQPEPLPVPVQQNLMLEEPEEVSETEAEEVDVGIPPIVYFSKSSGGTVIMSVRRDIWDATGFNKDTKVFLSIDDGKIIVRPEEKDEKGNKPWKFNRSTVHVRISSFDIKQEQRFVPFVERYGDMEIVLDPTMD